MTSNIRPHLEYQRAGLPLPSALAGYLQKFKLEKYGSDQRSPQRARMSVQVPQR